MTGSSNPTLTDHTYRDHLVRPGDEQMTINGAIAKTGIVTILVMATFSYAWNMFSGTEASGAIGLVVGASLLGVLLSLVISFKQTMAPVLAPVFALVEGFVLGGFSAVMEASYPGIAMQAGLATMGVVTGLLVLYRTRILKISSRFVAVTQLAMWSIFFIYMASFLLSFAGITFPFIHNSGPIGIGFSLLVIVVASMMMLTDFHMIEQGAAVGAPKYMEWYSAFALLVSVVWLYIEMLRLFAKLRN